MTAIARPWSRDSIQQALRLPAVRIGLHVLAMGAVLVVPAVHVMSLPAPPTALLGWWFLALLFAACESLTVHFDFRGQAYTFTLAEVALVVALHSAAPADALIAYIAGMLIAQLLVLRQRLLKIAFNLVNGALEVVLTILVYRALVGALDPIDPLAWLATPLAVVPACLLSALFVARVVRIATGEWPMSLGKTLVPTTVGAITNATLGLGAVVLLRLQPMAAVITVVPTAVMYACYRAWGAERRQRQSMQFLYSCVRSLQLSDSPERAVRDLLGEIYEGLMPRVAELTLLGKGCDTARRTVLRMGEASEAMQAVGSLERELLTEIAAGPDAELVGSSDPGPAGSYLRVRGLEQGIVTLLRSGQEVFGVLLIADRVGDVETFTETDAELIGALGVQAGALLELDRLQDTLTQLEELQAQLEHAAAHDPLTGVANRRLFADQLEARIAEGTVAGILFIDLDGFKEINDTLGHAAGDEVLTKVADRLTGCVRAEDLVARLGGDEFAVLLADHGIDTMEAVAARLLDVLGAPLAVSGKYLRVAASIGIAAVEDVAEPTVSELLRRADWAMYQAKSSGKGRAVRYVSARVPTASLGDDLHACLRAGGLSVVYQPILDLSSGLSVGAEALARWDHPTRGPIPPDIFVPMAENAGLVGELTQHMLHTALQDIRDLHAAAPAGGVPWVSINLSPRELGDRDMVKRVLATFERADINPRRVVLELTESALLEDLPEAVRQLRLLQARGLRIALDDFGSGFSSLGYLSTLPVDILKIDRAYVQPLEPGSPAQAFLQALINLGHSVGATVLAEGVERPEQVPLLAAMGCDLAQGFALGMPARGLSSAVAATSLAGPAQMRVA